MYYNKMELEITNHAYEQMIERGIDKEQVMRTIKRGSRYKQTNGYLSVYGYIAVAYMAAGKGKYKIKTVMIR